MGSKTRARPSRRRSNTFFQSPSPVHSAHVGDEVEVHYRWHPLYGRRVRRQYSEQRADGRVVHVEAAPGVIIVLAAWMLDRAACADMVIGAPRAELAALVELHHLLIERGFRRSSLCDPRIVKEEQNEHFAEVGFDHGSSAGRGSASALHHVRFDPVAGHERVGAHESDRVSGEPLDASGWRYDRGARR